MGGFERPCLAEDLRRKYFFFIKKNEKLKGVALLMTCLVGKGTRMYVEALVGKGYEKEESNFD
jgi:transcriptional regulatory protein LevR